MRSESRININSATVAYRLESGSHTEWHEDRRGDKSPVSADWKFMQSCKRCRLQGCPGGRHQDNHVTRALGQRQPSHGTSTSLFSPSFWHTCTCCLSLFGMGGHHVISGAAHTPTQHPHSSQFLTSLALYAPATPKRAALGDPTSSIYLSGCAGVRGIAHQNAGSGVQRASAPTQCYRLHPTGMPVTLPPRGHP